MIVRVVQWGSCRKACDEGDMAEACHRYSAMFIKGVKDVCEKNMAEAFKYSLKVSHDVHANNIDGFGDTWTVTRHCRISLKEVVTT